ncbi:MAG: NAD(P)-dependent alcohol dehydrogenase [Bradymonadales bacterium]|nr:NAD(P)-dependent alcohol dehydrogenase [Bradymonadales bacterium]
MKAYEIRDRFGLQQLTLTERPAPPCGHGQVRIRVKAVSLNYRDYLVVQGEYNPRQRLPLIPVSDGVGEVVETGPGVEGIRVGERVAGSFVQGWLAGPMPARAGATTLGSPLDGMLAEEVVLPETGVIAPPDHLTDIEAATLPCAALTAWSALFVHGRLGPGQTVLLEGTGGVSLFALQFALLAGARVIITSKSDEKLEKAAGLGAHHTINYRQTPDWGKAVQALTGGSAAGVDLVIEVGGAETLPQALRAVRVGGTICLIGILSGNRVELPLTSILMRGVRVQGLLVGSREGFEAMNRAIASHQIRPVVDRVFPFEQAGEAFSYLASGRHFGKVCIAVGD